MPELTQTAETHRGGARSNFTLEELLNTNPYELKGLYTNKRTRLHNQATIGWLQKRYHEKTSKTYLLLPEQVNEHENIKKIFENFDKDGSNSLDLLELTEMFQMYNIDIQGNFEGKGKKNGSFGIREILFLVIFLKKKE